MKKIIFFLLAIFLSINLANAEKLVYPIQEMSKLENRWSLFSTLSSSQKRTLPIVDETKYAQIAKENWWYNEYTRIYTVLWWSTYEYWWDVGNWGHWWIDIATSEWTPVYSIASWKVIMAWDKWAWWKLVAIEHTINWKRIVSSYAHLSKINVSVWDKIAWDIKIWEVWSTWNSTWNHLHFQIDSPKAPFNPYYTSIHNFSKLEWNTIDPIAFLNSNWATIKEFVQTKEKVTTQWLLSREEIEAREIKEFLKYHKLSLKYTEIWNNLDINKKWTLRLTVTDIWWKKFNWTLPWGWLEFVYDSSYLKLLPSKLIQVDRWLRDIVITPLKKWKVKITANLWKNKIKTIYVNIYNPKDSLYAASWEIITNYNVSLWDIKTWAVVLKDNSNHNLLNIKYWWKYILESKDSSIELCLKTWTLSTISKNLNQDCISYSNKIEFTYDDTVLWILLYKYRLKDTWKHWLFLINTYDNKLFNLKNVNWVFPQWLTKKYPFFDSIIWSLSNWITDIYRRWYFSEDRELVNYDWINWIRNSLLKISNNTTNLEIKSLAIDRLKKLRSEDNWKFTKVSRNDFLNLVWKYLIFRDIDNIVIENNYKDLTLSENKLVNYIYNKDNFWKDEKFPTYFNSSKNITRWEAAYILYNTLN